MRIIVTTESDTFSLEVSEELELESFKVLCESECNISSTDIVVVYDGKRLTDDKKSLKEHGIKDGDLIMVMSGASVLQRAAERMQQLQRNPPPSSGSQDDPAMIRDMILANPEELAMLKHNNPKLADALSSGDLENFTKVLREQQEARRDRERQRNRLISADPFDMEAQKLIADEIQQENINANMEAAMEFNPESFGTVHMLYINCLVNGHPVKAFIDSGAQTTIMSQACAERCNIMRLVDTRWAGIAKGVGTQRIIGRVHMGQIQIEGAFLASSFSILEEQPMDMLLGLDMLKRHQMCIDLKENQLIIGSSNTKTRFLNESELPECARLTPLTEEEALKQSERSAKQSEDHALAKALADSARESSEKVIKSRRTDSEGRTATTSTSAENHSASSHGGFPESDINEIMQIGFSREDVINELQKQNGNKTQAIAALFAKSFKM